MTTFAERRADPREPIDLPLLDQVFSFYLLMLRPRQPRRDPGKAPATRIG